MFIYKNRHLDVRRVPNRRIRAADNFSFVREQYNNVKYKNSPYYKGSLIWDTLPPVAKQCTTISEFKKCLKTVYNAYNENMS